MGRYSISVTEYGSDNEVRLCDVAEAKAQRAPHWPGADNWRSIACECEAHGTTLNLREQRLVSEVAWTARTAPAERQQVWLLVLLNKVRHG
jgi:hypothetical protein